MDNNYHTCYDAPTKTGNLPKASLKELFYRSKVIDFLFSIDITKENNTTMEKVQLVDLLNEQEKKGIFSFIDGLVAKQKTISFLVT